MRKLLLQSVGLLLFATAAFAQSGGAATTRTSGGTQPSACTCQCNCPTNDASQCSCNCTCPNQAQATMSSSANSSRTQPAGATSSQAQPSMGRTSTSSAQPATEYNDQDDAQGEPIDEPTANKDPVLQSRPAAPSASAIPAGSRIVPAGTELLATLDRLLSSKTAQQGDTFTATLSEPVKARNGAVLLPAGSKLQGEVTDVEQGKVLASVRGKARLDLRFRQVTLPNGTNLPITASLLGVNETGKKTGASSDEEGGVSSGTTGGRVAKDVGIGAGIGTVAGLIFGSALKGLAIGAIAGGGYVLATAGKDVELPAETGLRVRLDQNVPIPANAVNAR